MGIPSSTHNSATGFGPPVAPDEVGTLGPYRLIKELGRGGMGTVYAAIDTRLERPLALKVMLPKFAADAAAKERFLREARAAAKISHDHVVTVYEADERQGVPHIAMQFLKGYPLDDYLKKYGQLDVKQVVRIGGEAALGLAAAHELGLSHRDIKPGNIWLEAPNGRVKLLDFGLAKPVDGDVELTKSGAVVGTPAYMSPEQARSAKVDHRSDLFSLGAMLYRLCTGKLPFHGETTMAVLMALASDTPPPIRELNPQVPQSLADLIHEMLAKNVAERPTSATKVAERLRAIAKGEVPTAVPGRPLVEAMPTYVPLAVSVAESNPFAGIDDDSTEYEDRPAQPQGTAEKKKPNPLWLMGGLFAAFAVVIAGVIIIIKNKDGTTTKIEVPEGSTVEIKGKDGKSLAKVGPEKTAPKNLANDPDRRAAELVIGLGGTLGVNGNPSNINVLSAIPKDKFNLTAIDLGGTKMSDTGMKTLKELKSLAWLSLGGTQVTDTGLKEIKDIKELEQLHLGGTQVGNAGLKELRELKSLGQLSLFGTQVTDAGLKELKELKSLFAIGLQDTRVGDAGMKELKAIKKLTHLHLNGTGVTDTGLQGIGELNNLIRLDLANTQVSDAAARDLKELKKLTHLDIRKTKVTPAGIEELRKALPQCKIEHDGGVIEAIDFDRKAAEWVLSIGSVVGVNGENRNINAVADLPKGPYTLTSVGFGENKQVTDAGLAHFKECKNLTRLWLHNTAVSDAGLAHLKECKNLRDLYLKQTKVTPAGIEELRKALPQCKIEHDGGVIEPKVVVDPDRKAAEWVLSIGGIVRVNGERRDIKAVADLPKGPYRLTYVDLHSNPRATDVGLAVFQNCKELTELNLADTPVTEAGLAAFKDCKGLTQIHLNHTKVTEAGLAVFKDCKGLTMLGLGHSPVTDAWRTAFKDCKGLTNLDLASTKVTDAGLKELQEFKYLSKLYLHDTQVSDTGLKELQETKSLTYLDLRSTKVTPAGIEELRKALPQCKIEHDGGVIEPKK